MPTDKVLKTINVFPDQATFEQNEASLQDGELSLVPVKVVKTINGAQPDAAGNITINMRAHVVETGRDGDYWYRKYSDGFIVQGGLTPSVGAGYVIQLLIPFSNTNYSALATCEHWDGYIATAYNKTVSSFTTKNQLYANGRSGTMKNNWVAYGY